MLVYFVAYYFGVCLSILHSMPRGAYSLHQEEGCNKREKKSGEIHFENAKKGLKRYRIVFPFLRGKGEDFFFFCHSLSFVALYMKIRSFFATHFPFTMS